MGFKKIYYYIFYQFWAVFEGSPTKWGTVWKANLMICIIENLIITDAIIYYTIYGNRFYNASLTSPEVCIPFFAIFVVNYFAFSHDDTWMDYANEFNEWPRKKNLIGGIIVFVFVALIIGFMLNGFYLMSKINWQEYRR